MTESNTPASDRALRLRERVKGRKPKFVRPESWRYFRLKESWRNPRGLDHKVRLMYKGWPPAAGSGYGGPKVAKGLHPSGYREVLVYNVEQLGKIDAKTEAVRIAHRVGKKKRADILAEARRKKIVVLNLRRVREAAEEKPVEEKEEGKTADVEKETEETEDGHEEKKPKPEEKTKKRGRRTEQQ